MQNIIHLVKVLYGKIRNSIYFQFSLNYSREIFIKTDNYIDGVFFADLLKVNNLIGLDNHLYFLFRKLWVI
jgi:hypothetical protein